MFRLIRLTHLCLMKMRINKTNVLADLRSAGIKYKDLFNPLKYRC